MGSPILRPSRRDLLRLGVTSVAALTVAGCDAFSLNPSEEAGGKSPKPVDVGLKEAPALAEQVKAGTLPARAQRLPKNPLVVQPTEEMGVYGGTWNTILTSVDADPHLTGSLSYEPLVRWDVNQTKVSANIVESWEVTQEGRVYTFVLREGMKWSDGKPYTADDLVFSYEDVLSNKDLYPLMPQEFAPDGRPAKFEKVDARTVRFTFPVPHGLFLEQLASTGAATFHCLPRHYLEQFHHKYNANADKQAKDAGFTDWTKLFLAKGGGGPDELSAWQNPDLPCIYPWKVRSFSGTRLQVERNPYYWKTDPEGRQLPYLDRVVFDIVTDPQVSTLKLNQGDYSLVTPGLVTLQSKPVLARGRSQGHYHFIDIGSSRMNDATFIFNLNHKNPAMRQMLQNKDFRIGLSYALNRQEIIKVVLLGQGEPWQTSPRRESGLFLEELAKQYTEHDVAKANQHLDAAGFRERDGDGFRLRADGQRVAFTLEVRTNFNPLWADIGQLASGYWKTVGVDGRVKVEDATLLTNRVQANEHDAVMDDGDGGALPMLGPGWYFPNSGDTAYAVKWGEWYETKGKSGEEPPAGPRRQMELFDQIRITPDRQKREDLFMEILRISQQEFYLIGTVLPVARYNVVQDNLRNVAKSMVDDCCEPGPSYPEQYFWSAK
ncbi:ABC transporter substrate-binding protein [Actinopolymorpha pittospori]|uniref:Peptide/nickel transport system substrate-binding protein n=1 Tax=Actinopolymorpha pittospori TaxID=648752 RepID=A0A927RBC0_9ACTN|nr:ABC transporter substrate-binding protein [Actinopolymorpha pittospori]MBE1605910.1 peptide/nickel transport system substrate-binding protein [Actinopolymorpha pittospori]